MASGCALVGKGLRLPPHSLNHHHLLIVSLCLPFLCVFASLLPLAPRLLLPGNDVISQLEGGGRGRTARFKAVCSRLVYSLTQLAHACMQALHLPCGWRRWGLGAGWRLHPVVAVRPLNPPCVWGGWMGGG